MEKPAGESLHGRGNSRAGAGLRVETRGAGGEIHLALPVSGDTVDWNTVKVVLARISEEAGDFLEENILIGGAAAWFYRSLLENAKDVDFPAPVYSEEEDRIWLSKDVDFIGTPSKEIAARLGVEPSGDPLAARVEGVWIDSPDEGLFITRERASITALRSELPDGTEIQIASPVLLHREKSELIRRKNRAQDRLHLETLELAAKLVFCRLAEVPEFSRASCRELFRLLKEAQENSPVLLMDGALHRRMQLAIGRMRGVAVCRSVLQLLEKQILPLMAADKPSA